MSRFGLTRALDPCRKVFRDPPAAPGLHHGREQSHRLAEKGFMNDRYGTANPTPTGMSSPILSDY